MVLSNATNPPLKEMLVYWRVTHTVFIGKPKWERMWSEASFVKKTAMATIVILADISS